MNTKQRVNNFKKLQFLLFLNIFDLSRSLRLLQVFA